MHGVPNSEFGILRHPLLIGSEIRPFAALFRLMPFDSAKTAEYIQPQKSQLLRSRGFRKRPSLATDNPETAGFVVDPRQEVSR